MVERVVVIGAGQAGAQAAISLRQWGYEGQITLLGEEREPPYQRPPLSKAYMKGEMEKDRLYLKKNDWYSENQVDLKLNTHVERIDRVNKTVVLLNSEEVIPYDKLVLATGSRPRQLDLPNSDVEGVFSLRGISDVDRIQPNMEAGKKVVIIGAGYIGLEAAAVSRQLGLDVTVVETAPRILARVTSPKMSEFYTKEHVAQGVDILTNVGLKEIRSEDGCIHSVLLDNGSVLQADLLLVGIGILPNAEIAKDAGIFCDNGVVVDEDTRTNDPDIFAVGDCAKRPLVHYGRSARLESVHNAIEQGKLAAAAILERKRPLEDCPWFWSDQYDLKLQIAGLSEGYDTLVVRGDPAERKFAVFYLKDKKLLAVDAVNSAPEFLVSKKLITMETEIEAADLEDMDKSMKDFMPPKN